MRLLVALALAFSIALAARPGAADEDDFEMPDPWVQSTPFLSPVPADFMLQLGLGAFDDADHTGGMELDGLALLRYGILDVGGVLESGSQPLGYRFGEPGVAAGLGLRPASGVRTDILAVVGADTYSHVGQDGFGDDPGAGGTVPAAGVRLALTFPFNDRPNHLVLSGVGSYDADFGRIHASYLYQKRSWFGGIPDTAHADHTIGTRRWGLTINLGGSFDFE